MSFSLTQPAQLHRHTFSGDGGVPPPPAIEGSFWKCVRAWKSLPMSEQPFYFLSLENMSDFGFDDLLRLDHYRPDARK